MDAHPQTAVTEYSYSTVVVSMHIIRNNKIFFYLRRPVLCAVSKLMPYPYIICVR